MNLHIGLFRNQPGWQTLLQQEGVSFSIVDEEKISESNYSVIILNAKPTKRQKEVLTEYLNKGGAILSSTIFLEKIVALESRTRKIPYLQPEQNSIFYRNALADIWSFGKIPDIANALTTTKHTFSSFIGSFSNGVIVCFPIDLGTLIERNEARRKFFYAEHSRFPAEQVSIVSKGEIRKLISSSLEYLHHQRNIPYVHVWYFPDRERNSFAFRIDSDYGTEKEIFSLYKVLQNHNISATWFLDVKNHKNFLARFRGMEGQELSLHCHEHQTFDTYSKNKRNIELARKKLIEANIMPKGFASPFGLWNIGLQKTLDEFGFAYSSEFAFDYDNLPSFPLVGKHFASTLQIPIHPICIGSLRSARMNEKQMIQYFNKTFTQKLAWNEPLFFYDHPKDFRSEIWATVFKKTQEEKIRCVTFSEFASWWKRRSDAVNIFSSEKYVPTFEKGSIRFPSLEKDISFRISPKEKMETIVSAHNAIQNIKLSSLHCSKALECEIPENISSTRIFSPRLLNQRIRIFLRRKLKPS